MKCSFLIKFLAAGVLAAAFLLGLGADRLSAQVVKGSISGSVIDQSGAVVPNAQIKVIESSTSATATGATDVSGLFHIPLLGIGTYNLSVTKEGFSTLTLTGVQVQSAQDTGLGALQLEVGQVTTMVEVSAAPPVLQTTQSQISSSLTATTIQEFPGVLENQGLDALALQLPGVVASRDNNFANYNGGTGFSVNGLRGRSNDQQVDGQNNNDNSVTGPAMFVANPDFVQEYQVTTSNFGPEYGRNSGSVVNIITKSGTNNWHGDAFVTESSWKLGTLSNTQKAFEGLKQLPKFNDEFSGISGGGPIKKDKFFIFAGWDNQIIPGTTNYSTGNLTPTPTGLSQLAACFPNSTSVAALQSYGPYGIKGGNPIPSGTPQTIGVTKSDGSTCNVEFAGVQRTLATPYHQYDFILRGDWNGVKDKMYVRYLRQTQNPENADSFVRAAVGYPVSVPSYTENIGVSWTRSFTTNLVNEARLSYGRETVEFGGNSIGNTIPRQANLGSGLSDIRLPSGYASFGPLNSSPQGRIINTYQFQDNLSYFHGHHQFKFGTNLTYQRSPNVFLPNYNGTFTFGTFDNFANNTPDSISITEGSPNLDFREHDSFFYAGDDWKIRPNFTLNLGLTWAYFGQPANLFHNSTVKQETGPNPFFDPALPLSVRTFPELPSPKNNWGPSVGFAYSPHWGGWLTGSGKMVVRGGYRMTYDPAFYNIYLNIASSAPQVLAQTLSGSEATAIPMLAAPFGPAVRDQLSPFLTLGVQDPRNFNQTGVTPNFRGDRVHSWSFGLQRELTSHAVVEARYVGNHGSDLFQSINLNPLIANLAAEFPSAVPSGVTPCPSDQAVVSRAVGRVNCDLGVFRQRTNTGVSDYNGLQTEFRATNLAKQLTLRTAFTWSKTTDNVSDIFGTGAGGNTVAFSQDPLNYVNAEHGVSGISIPESWTLAFNEQIPAHRDQRGVVGHFLGGWSIAGTYIISSGEPYTPVQYGLGTFSGADIWDTRFNTGFAGQYETARPYVSNPSAAPSTVGIYAGDACSYLSVGCSLSASQLLNFNMANTTGAEQTITNKDVRFIVNAPQANTIFGTPWGSAGRNTLRDYQTNIANFSVFKTTKVTERVSVRFNVTFINVFNHPNFYSVDPYVDDAGLTSENTGFALPSLWAGTLSAEGQRQIKFGLRVSW